MIAQVGFARQIKQFGGSLDPQEHGDCRRAIIDHLTRSMDDSVPVRCTRCKSVFRERARRLQNGYARQCPTCEVVLFFDEDSPNADVRRMMRAARTMRKRLREEDEAVAMAAAAPGPSRHTRGRGRVTSDDE